MTTLQLLLTIALLALGILITRAAPFCLFPAGKPTPRFVRYLGKVLPPAMFGLLIIYCLKNVNLFAPSHGIPELIALAVVVALHLWRRQMLLSIAGGTVCYMLLVQTIF